jgi:hypothetical protein
MGFLEGIPVPFKAFELRIGFVPFGLEISLVVFQRLKPGGDIILARGVFQAGCFANFLEFITDDCQLFFCFR